MVFSYSCVPYDCNEPSKPTIGGDVVMYLWMILSFARLKFP